MAWMSVYTSPPLAALIASIVMVSPPLLTLGRETTSDALATLVAFSSLYLIFQKNFLVPGLTILLASTCFRTDFVVLAGPVLLACWLKRQLRFWQTAVLAALAIGSVFAINHYAGDYGIKMLYYRNFVGTPLIPGEMPVQYSARDYFPAFRSGLVLVAGSFFLPFLLAVIGGLASSSGVKTVAMVALAYTALHFLVLPNWDDRWFGIFYLSMGLAAAAGLATRSGSRFLLRFKSASECESAA
jgi:hypothetical protein